MTYDYSAGKIFSLDPKQNTFALRIINGSEDQDGINSNLRVMFRTANVGRHIFTNSTYCKNFFADEIAAELNGTSDSTFFTETFSDPVPKVGLSWICPDVSSIEIQGVDDLKNL